MHCFVGNSHVDQFNIPTYSSRTGQPIDRIYCMGASVKGLMNPNSISGLRSMILDYQSKNPSSKLVFFLGQVDLDFGYYYKCVKDNVKHDMREYVDNLVSLYEMFLSTYITNAFTVLGINPSVIRDIRHNYNVSFQCPNGATGFYSEVNRDLRFEDVGHIYSDSLETRCMFTKMFNQSLAGMCARRHFNFIDISPVLFDGNGVLKSKYVPDGEMHHHLKPTADTDMLEFIMPLLK